MPLKKDKTKTSKKKPTPAELAAEREKMEHERDDIERQLASSAPTATAIQRASSSEPAVAPDVFAAGGLVNVSAMVNELEQIAHSAANIFALMLDPLLKQAVTQKMTGSLVTMREAIEQEFEAAQAARQDEGPAQGEASIAARYGPKAKPKALIIGLYDKQVGVIEREFNKFLTLSYCHTDRVDQLKKVDLSNRPVYVMADHINHKTIDMVRSRGTEPIRVNGSLTELRGALRKLIEEEQKNVRELRAA